MTIDSPIEIIDYQANEVIDWIVEESLIIFVAEGDIDISLEHTESRIVNKGKLFLIPLGACVSIHFRDKSSLIFVRLPEDFSLVECLDSKEIYYSLKENQSYAKTDYIVPLEINESILFFLKGFHVAIRDGLTQADYLAKKIGELLFLMRTYYPKSLVVSFFSPLFSDDLAFKTLILQHRNKIFTVRELASMSHASLTPFRARFKRVFGLTPSQWINEERAKWIEYELTMTHKPLKQISEECGFLSISHFNKFVSMHLKLTPAKIRNTPK